MFERARRRRAEVIITITITITIIFILLWLYYWLLLLLFIAITITIHISITKVPLADLGPGCLQSNSLKHVYRPPVCPWRDWCMVCCSFWAYCFPPSCCPWLMLTPGSGVRSWCITCSHPTTSSVVQPPTPGLTTSGVCQQSDQDMLVVPRRSGIGFHSLNWLHTRYDDCNNYPGTTTWRPSRVSWTSCDTTTTSLIRSLWAISAALPLLGSRTHHRRSSVIVAASTHQAMITHNMCIAALPLLPRLRTCRQPMPPATSITLVSLFVPLQLNGKERGSAH